jgi:hypothetical protein
MRLRYICFFLCETLLAACSSFICDEGAGRGLNQDPSSKPNDEARDEARLVVGTYVDYHRTEAKPSLPKGNGRLVCTPSTKSGGSLDCVVQTPKRKSNKCRKARPVRVPRSGSLLKQRRRPSTIPADTRNYDVVIYPNVVSVTP